MRPHRAAREGALRAGRERAQRAAREGAQRAAREGALCAGALRRGRGPSARWGRAGALLLLMLMLMMLLAACGGGGEELASRLVVDGNAARLHATPRRGDRLLVLAGPPWTPGDALDAELPGLRVPRGRAVRVAEVALTDAARDGAEVRLLLDAQRLAALPDPCVVQPCAIEASGGLVAVGSAWVLTRPDGSLRAVPFDEHLRAGVEPAPLALAALVALVAVGLAALRWPRRGLPRAAGIAVGVLALGAVLALRLSDEVHRNPVERGYATPPLVWPGRWSLRDDVLERVLGPGYRALLERARGEAGPLVVVSPSDGLGYARGVHLAHALGAPLVAPGEEVPGAPAPALVLDTAGTARGELLLRTDAGALARTAP